MSLERVRRIREVWNLTTGKVFRDNLSKARKDAKDALNVRVINEECK